MLRTLTERPEPQSDAAIAVMAAAQADILVLGDLDWDHNHAGLTALQDRLEAAGQVYSFTTFPQPVSGQDSGFDLDEDGRRREPEDAIGYGRFTGDNGVAILSKLPLGRVETHHQIKWVDRASISDLVPQGADTVLPLASSALWEVEVEHTTLLAFSLSPPVFDGPEDRNGRRNRDQIAFLKERAAALRDPVLVGRLNLDPNDGDGWRDVASALLSDPHLQDPQPSSVGGQAAPNPSHHIGDPGLDTADWQDGPGPLRVDYILPSRKLKVVGSGVFWPGSDDPMREDVEVSGANRLVWVDLEITTEAEHSPPAEPNKAHGN